MDRTVPRKHRPPRGPRPRSPRPCDAAAEALIEATHAVCVEDDIDWEHFRGRRNQRHHVLHWIADAMNHQRRANGLPPLSDADRAAIGFPAWSALATVGLREAA